MKCNHCGNEAEWVENKEVYGRNYGQSYTIWLCRPCDAYVGCHKNTREAKGQYLAKRPLRIARKAAHAFIDPLWQNGKYGRGYIYKTLSDAFGYQVHIGATKTPEECYEIIETAKKCFEDISNK